jgi:hypothetical protein
VLPENPIADLIAGPNELRTGKTAGVRSGHFTSAIRMLAGQAQEFWIATAGLYRAVVGPSISFGRCRTSSILGSI